MVNMEFQSYYSLDVMVTNVVNYLSKFHILFARSVVLTASAKELL
jgi:hypothetical protein